MSTELLSEPVHQQALALHKKLTPEYEAKKAVRTEHLLPTLQAGCEYGQPLENIGQGWAFTVGRHFFDALDCKLSQYIHPETKKKLKRWSQGSAFDFSDGHVLHSAPGFPLCCLQIKEALPAQAGGFQLEKHEHEPTHLPESNPETGLRVKVQHKPKAKRFFWHSTIQTRRDPGKVIFDVYLPGTEAPWRHHKTVTITQDAFVRLLITGEGLEGI